MIVGIAVVGMGVGIAVGVGIGVAVGVGIGVAVGVGIGVAVGVTVGVDIVHPIIIINKPIVCKTGIFTYLFINSLFLFLY
tara:strand:- start:1090 stop:1329 length:240 start_codon:yes stop_codon:yes gene_type:complete